MNCLEKGEGEKRFAKMWRKQWLQIRNTSHLLISLDVSSRNLAKGLAKEVLGEVGQRQQNMRKRCEGIGEKKICHNIFQHLVIQNWILPVMKSEQSNS